MKIEAKLNAMGLTLPSEPAVPPDIRVSFDWVRVHEGRAYVSGHGPQNSDGTYAGPFGKVEVEVSTDEAYQASRLTALSVLGSLKRSLGDLDRVTAWLSVNGMVNAVPGSTASTNVINGFSDLIIDLYGPEAGRHARTAIGMAALPLNLCVVIGAEVAIRET